MSEPVTLALRVSDPALAERLAEILGDVPGLILAGPGEAADAALTDILAEGPPGPVLDGGLTPREREVLGLMTEGASNKEIGRTLGISVHTAKFHVGRLLDKLDATGRTDAVAQAARTGLVHL